MFQKRAKPRSFKAIGQMTMAQNRLKMGLQNKKLRDGLAGAGVICEQGQGMSLLDRLKESGQMKEGGDVKKEGLLARLKESGQMEGGESSNEHSALANLRAHVRTSKLLEVSQQMTEKNRLIEAAKDDDQRGQREGSTPLSWDSHGTHTKSYDSHDNQTVDRL